MEINEGENIFDKLKELATQLDGNFNILENVIDVNVQMEYFKYSKNVKIDLDKDLVLNKFDILFREDTSISEKKHLLSQLASLDDVKAYRAIEKYLKTPDKLLRNWALMAFQESKMLLESSLLDENQVFISTGLGGKGKKLRYFIVLFSKSGDQFNKVQEKVIKNEFEFILKKNNAEIEEINFSKKFSTLLVLLPLTVTIHQIFEDAINECNEYGDFIEDNFIITNVKKLTKKEITEFIKGKKITGMNEMNDGDSIDLF